MVLEEYFRRVLHLPFTTVSPPLHVSLPPSSLCIITHPVAATVPLESTGTHRNLTDFLTKCSSDLEPQKTFDLRHAEGI